MFPSGTTAADAAAQTTTLHSVFLRFQRPTTQDTEQHEFIHSFSLHGRYERRQKGIGAESAISLRPPRRFLAERQKKHYSET